MPITTPVPSGAVDVLDDFTYRHVPSPIGTLLLAGRPPVLSGLWVADHEACPPVRAGWREDGEAFGEAVGQLAEYFGGSRTDFDLEVALLGTPFQLEVWGALRHIPYGSVVSYGEMARRVRRPTGSRAVGAAVGRNPVSVVVPCHRVVGSTGALTGYGWGTRRKAWLLDHERGVSARQH